VASAVGKIDDLHFLQWRTADGMKVSNHLKYVAHSPSPLVLVGVGLTEAGLFTEGRTQRESTLAQTARRTTRLTMEPFAHKPAGQKHWRSVLHAIEARVVLAKHRDGTQGSSNKLRRSGLPKSFPAAKFSRAN